VQCLGGCNLESLFFAETKLLGIVNYCWRDFLAEILVYRIKFNNLKAEKESRFGWMSR